MSRPRPAAPPATEERTALDAPGDPDASERGRLDDRSRRARTEPMAVRSFGTATYGVETEGGGYLVDLEAGRCTCPDHRFRDARCKHLRRVAIEVTEGLLAPPGHVAVDCADCDREVFVPARSATDGPQYCPRHRLRPGDVALDRETGRRVSVVAGPAGRADEVPVPGTDGTVADYPTNAGYDPENPVVGAVYPGGRVTGEGVRPESLRVYAFPRSRLRRLSPDRDADGDDRESGIDSRSGPRPRDGSGDGAGEDSATPSGRDDPAPESTPRADLPRLRS